MSFAHCLSQLTTPVGLDWWSGWFRLVPVYAQGTNSQNQSSPIHPPILPSIPSTQPYPPQPAYLKRGFAEGAGGPGGQVFGPAETASAWDPLPLPRAMVRARRASRRERPRCRKPNWTPSRLGEGLLRLRVPWRWSFFVRLLTFFFFFLRGVVPLLIAFCMKSKLCRTSPCCP